MLTKCIVDSDISTSTIKMCTVCSGGISNKLTITVRIDGLLKNIKYRNWRITLISIYTHLKLLNFTYLHDLRGEKY